MKQAAFKMYLKKGHKAEYEKRHKDIWPELKELLKEAGISDYSIFLDEETHTLFAVQKIKNSTGSQDLSSHPIVKKWWDFMADIMDVNPDNSPVSIPLEKVFYLE